MCFDNPVMAIFSEVRVHANKLYFRPWVAAAAILALVGVVQAEADELSPNLTVHPTQCVVLEEGQKCHAKVQVEWSTELPVSVCLHNSLVQKPVRCWEDTIEGAYQEKVIARSSVYYFLKPVTGDEVLAEAELNVAWVYRESRRPSRQWRLF